jgi:gas vesicle protein
MKLTEGLMLGLIMGGIVTITINLMVAELQGATLRIYKDNIHQFVDVMNENKGRDFATYKDKLNSRINCIENQCSYTTQYKNEGIKNTDVVIQLDKNNKVPEKIIYKFNSIEMVNSDDKNTKKTLEYYYSTLSKKLNEKGAVLSYSTNNENSVTLKECFKNKDTCLLVVKINK